MSKKKRIRFLKLVLIYSLVMATVITFGALLIGWRAVDISSGTVAALCGLWSIELGLSAFVKISEGKTLPKSTKTTNDTEESI